MGTEDDRTLTVEFDQESYDRLMAVTDAPEELLREAGMKRVELEESIAFTRDDGFHGPEGFAKMADDNYPAWPLGSTLGIELDSMGDGESRWHMVAGPEHTNPLGTMHGGVLCDIGDAALSTACMSTLEEGQLFTTVDLRINFLRPYRTAGGVRSRSSSGAEHRDGRERGHQRGRCPRGKARGNLHDAK